MNVTTSAVQRGQNLRGADMRVIEQIVSAFVVSQIVVANTLHARGVLDKRHLAYGFARALDALPRDGEGAALVVDILQTVKNYHMQVTLGEQPDVHAWLREVTAKRPPPEQ